MRNHMRAAWGITRAALVVGVMLGPGVAVQAGSIEIFSDEANSTEGLGSFTGSLEYEFDPFADIGFLSVTLTNTSDPDNGGFITGFVFNIASADTDASATFTSGSHPFENLTDGGLNAQPFGNPFDAGAALGGKFLGGGSPTDGIAVGDTGIFEFDVMAFDAADLTALSFLTGGPYEFNFIVRFKGFENGGSDKVPGTIIPLPPGLALGGLGLLGAMFGARRVRRSL